METITIQSANQDDHDLIGLDAGSPVACIERLALGYDDHPVEWRYARSSATAFHYKVEIR